MKKGYYKFIVLGDTLVTEGKIEEAFQMFNIGIKFNPDYDEYIDRGNKIDNL